MQVLKFGGSSVGTVENIKRVKSILADREQPYIAVVSAFAGVTSQFQVLAEDALKGEYEAQLQKLKELHMSRTRELLKPVNQSPVLIAIQKQFLEVEAICSAIACLGELSDRSLVRLLGRGEVLSSVIIHHYLKQEGLDIQLLDSEKLIVANGSYRDAQVDFDLSYSKIKREVHERLSYLAPGFVASNHQEESVVLGRGGSDYSAALFAGAMNAQSLELWSDVNGMLNADPNVVRQARSIEEMSYAEAYELAFFGAKVVYPPAISPVAQKRIPVYLKNTLAPSAPGTLIRKAKTVDRSAVKGVSAMKNMSVLTLAGVGMARKKGTARRLFQALEEAAVNVVLISQACSEQSICLGVESSEAEKAKKAINVHFEQEMLNGWMQAAEISPDKVIVAVVGDGMKHQVGLSGKIFSALGENNVNVVAIAQGASERNISIVIEAADEHKAVNVIHERFFDNAYKKVHLFVAGVGNVGAKFMELLQRQHDAIKEQFQIDLRLVGLCNSKKYILDPQGLDLKEWKKALEQGRSYDSFDQFAEVAQGANLRNSVFVDNTASEAVSKVYRYLLSASISVVCCNKIASSWPMKQYSALLEAAEKHNCQYRSETTVAAALPVLKTIEDLRLGGDRIQRIEAVVSGSLNFIFNQYDTSRPFAEVVRQAMEEGYTEPDPRIDLSGLDVKRKILILSRQAGMQSELEEVRLLSFLPESSENCASVADFLQSLDENEAHFRSLYEHALQRGAKLKVVAELVEGEMNVALKEIPADSPFYNLSGKDNIVAMYTDLYAEQPLVVQGAGAGAEVTASGVFSDLIYAVNQK